LEEAGDFSAREMTALSGFRDTLRGLTKRKEEEPLLTFVNTVMELTGYLASWQASDEEEAGDRLENLSELVNAVSEYMERAEPPTLENFLEEVALLTDIDDVKTGDQDFVTLMTLHASKGLEFSRVFITGLEAGLFPMVRDRDAEEDYEEERRLFYVGLTRAKTYAALFHAGFRRRFGSAMSCLPSPFLAEMPEDCIRRIDRTIRQTQYREEARPASFNFTSKSREAAVAAPRYEDYSQEETSFHKGMRVRHPLWGRGVITDLSGFSDDMKATVKFDNASEKRLVLKYAKLEAAQ